MKKIICMMLLFVAAGSTTLFAQENQKNKKDNFNWQKQYMDSAGIAADVQGKIEAIKKEAEPKVKAIRKDDSLTEDVKKEKIKEINKKKGEDINALLSKEQKAKIKEIKERLKKEGGDN